MQSPEQALATAVIERALLDIFTRRGKHRISAMQWFDHDEMSAFTFCWICEHLDLDAQLLRSIARKAYDDGVTISALAPRSKNAFLRRFLAYADQSPAFAFVNMKPWKEWK